MMTFKEFAKWCNERACDGCWGFNEAIICIDAGSQIRKLPFWKREKAWREINSKLEIEERIVVPTNKKIEEYFSATMECE